MVHSLFLSLDINHPQRIFVLFRRLLSLASVLPFCTIRQSEIHASEVSIMGMPAYV